MTDNVVSLGERLKSRREELGLSQAQAARELDVARTAYRLWEMEAAKPAPDRWRMIARWLGISVAGMLLADELINADEAKQMDQLAGRFPGGDEGEFFMQSDPKIGLGSIESILDEAESARMLGVFRRVHAAVPHRESPIFLPADFVKELLRAKTAPAEARAALLVTAAGIPEHVLRDAELLVSELVSMCVLSKGAESPTMTLHVRVESDRLRVEVMGEGTPTSPSAGMGNTLMSELASRWGAGREGASTLSWFEMDLPLPGATARSQR